MADHGNYLVTTVHWWAYNMKKKEKENGKEKEGKRKEKKRKQTKLC